MLGRKGGRRRTMRGGVAEREVPFGGRRRTMRGGFLELIKEPSGGKRRTMRGGIFERNAR